jgi:fucose permease
MLLIAAAFIVGRFLTQKVVKQELEISKNHKMLALVSIALWVSVIVAGRLLAYTYTILLTTDYY